MSAAESSALSRAIAGTVADAILAAVAPGAPASAWKTARDAAQLLGLDGLDRLLATCMPHAGRPYPPEMEGVTERLARLGAACREAGDLSVFRDVDRELLGLAYEMAGYEWSPIGPEDAASRAAVATLSAADVLEDATLANEESRTVARRSRLSIPVAAALRAALDWLTPAHISAPAVRLHGEPSLLELRLERVTLDRLLPAHRVLSAVGGVLDRVRDGDGGIAEWVIRVPSFAARATYLLVIQGGIRIALPWHAVLRLRIVPAVDVTVGIRRLDHPLLECIATPSPKALEYPVVLIGHGLKRAWLLADRLVWRMVADPCGNQGGAPGVGLVDTVRTEDGEVFWLADPARMLADIELPEIEGWRASEPARTEARAPQRAPTPAPTPAPAPEAEPPTLTEADVEPLNERRETAPPVPARPAQRGASEAPTPIGPSAPPAAPAPAASEAVRAIHPRVLVAAESISARLFLTRLLERYGVEVASAASAAELARRLGDERWAVVFTDVAFRDAAGPDWLSGVRERIASAGSTRLVALVRDRRDLDAARAAGVAESLFKPFGLEAVTALLVRIGLFEEHA